MSAKMPIRDKHFADVESWEETTGNLPSKNERFKALEENHSDIIGKIREILESNKSIRNTEVQNALAVGIINETLTRVGNFRNENDGLVSLNMDNIDDKGDIILLEYVGKTTGDEPSHQKKTVRSPILVKRLKEQIELSKSNKASDILWYRPNPSSKNFDDQIRNWLKQFDPKITPHMFRHVKATATFQRAMKAGMTNREAAYKVADLLGHKKGTFTTAKETYIHPRLYNKHIFDSRAPVYREMGVSSRREAIDKMRRKPDKYSTVWNRIFKSQVQ